MVAAGAPATLRILVELDTARIDVVSQLQALLAAQYPPVVTVSGADALADAPEYWRELCGQPSALKVNSVPRALLARRGMHASVLCGARNHLLDLSVAKEGRRPLHLGVLCPVRVQQARAPNPSHQV